MSGAGFPRPCGIRESSPRICWSLGKYLKRSCRCAVFSSKDRVSLDVASATSMGRPERVVAVERASRSSGTPGSGLQEGKSSEYSSERRL